MATPKPCPGGCGQLVDYDAVPSYSEKRGRAGKFCSCGFPLDEETAKGDHLQYGPDTASIEVGRLDAIKKFRAA